MIHAQMTTKTHLGHRRIRVAARRRGAAMIETAFILIPLCIMTLGMLDFAIGVYRYHILSEAARQLARNAIVHGKMADKLGPWGPSTYTGSANAVGTINSVVKPFLVGIDPAAVTVKVEWPESSNDVEKSVRATLTTNFHPLMTRWFANSIALKAVSEMKIAH
jgi:Flp pilus assembly protein TadG